MPKKKIPKLLVVFDTNVLFTKIASDLVKHDVKRIIQENSNHPDLQIDWCLPEIIIGERKYQMIKTANELLPAVQRLETLLGHQLGIGEDTLELHVNKAITQSVKALNFQITKVDTSAVDWENLISRSVNREPPFEATEKEKGFRDSIIAQSFLQLKESSPTTPNVCRLAFVSEDKKLREYVSEVTQGTKNVRILSNLDALESLINTIVSTIPEEFAFELTEKAEKLFFEKENNKTFYYKESIGEKIREQYAKELSDTILKGCLRHGGTWWIQNPIFVKKNRQRIYWISTIEPEFEIYHYESKEPLGIGDSPSSPSQFPGILQPSLPNLPASELSLGLFSQRASGKKIIDLKGREKFEVHWSTNLSQAQNLTALKLENIKYVGNNLAENRS